MSNPKLGIRTFNKIILFVAQDYIYRTKKEGASVPPVLHKLEGAVKVFKQQNMFSVEEAKEVLKIARSEEIDAIMNKEVSFIIFTFELMKLWVNHVPKVDRPILNISDKHFKLGGRVFYQSMLKLKQENEDKHKDKKSIIDDSITVANEFFSYHKKVLL